MRSSLDGGDLLQALRMCCQRSISIRDEMMLPERTNPPADHSEYDLPDAMVTFSADRSPLRADSTIFRSNGVAPEC